MHTNHYTPLLFKITALLVGIALLLPATFTFAAKKEKNRNKQNTSIIQTVMSLVTSNAATAEAQTTTPPMVAAVASTTLSAPKPTSTVPIATSTTPEPAPEPAPTSTPPQQTPTKPIATTTATTTQPAPTEPVTPYPIPAAQKPTSTTTKATTTPMVMSFIQNGSPLQNIYSFSNRLTPTETKNLLAFAFIIAAAGLLLVDGRLLERLGQPRGKKAVPQHEPSTYHA